MSFGGGGHGDGGRWSTEDFCRHAGGRSRARGPFCLAQIYPSGLAAQVDEDAVVLCGCSFADSLVSAKWDTCREGRGLISLICSASSDR